MQTSFRDNYYLTCKIGNTILDALDPRLRGDDPELDNFMNLLLP
jgi:hypothetical protein